MSDNVRTLTPRPAPTPAPAAPAIKEPSDLVRLSWRLHAAGMPLYPLGGIK